MADRGKVIKAIEICYTLGHNCIERPLFKEDDCNNKLMHDALALLKEQEPKNVIAEKRRILFDDSGDGPRYYEDTFYHCPSCDFILSRTHINNGIHFCHKCGQAVKWE